MEAREKTCFIRPDLSPAPKEARIINKSKISNRFKAVYLYVLEDCFKKRKLTSG